MTDKPRVPLNDGHVPIKKGHTAKPLSKPATSGSVQGGHTPTTSSLPGKPPKK